MTRGESEVHIYGASYRSSCQIGAWEWCYKKQGRVVLVLTDATMTQTRALPLVDLSVLHPAARVLHDHFLSDAQTIPDVGDLLPRACPLLPPRPAHPPPAAGPPSSASYSVFPDDYRVPFQKRTLVGIPDALFQYYNSASLPPLSAPLTPPQPPASRPTWASSPR